MQICFLILLFVLGACLGSFLCCQARRLHLRTTPKSSAKTKTKSVHLGARSVCLSCGYQLKWYDNLPIISWLILKGKCRQCGHKIGLAEILSELGVGLAFLALGFGAQLNGITIESTCINPTEFITFVSALIFTTLLAFLAVYDGIYGQLPTIFLTFSIICAIIIATLREWASLSVVADFWPSLSHDLLNLLFAMLILGGLYLLLCQVSRGKWVGNGDWLLGTAIAIALGTPWLALIALFFANFLACIVMLPVAKQRHHHKIHFGPFMVIAFGIAFAFSSFFNSMISI